MKNNKCNDVMNSYLELDKNQRVPFGITMHILFCKKCRTEIKMLKEAEKAACEPIKFTSPLNDSSIAEVMKKVAPDTYEKVSKEPVSMKKWIVFGILMAIVLFIIVFLTRNFTSRDLLVANGFIIAGAVTIYCTFFVVGNIDYFLKKIASGYSF